VPYRRGEQQPTPDASEVALGGIFEQSWSERGGRFVAAWREPMSATKSYEEIIDFIAAGTAPEAVVAFRPSERVQQRVAELVERSSGLRMAASRPHSCRKLTDILEKREP
jgi:hypothetical protein